MWKQEFDRHVLDIGDFRIRGLIGDLRGQLRFVGGSSPEAQQLLQDSSKATTGLHSLHVNLQTADINTLPMESVNADVTNQPQELGGKPSVTP